MEGRGAVCFVEEERGAVQVARRNVLHGAMNGIRREGSGREGISALLMVCSMGIP